MVRNAIYGYANGQRVAKIKPDGTIIFYINDPLGSPLILMDGDGNIVKRYRFDPWGNLEAQWGTEPNHYLFTGKEKDENGLYYFGARYYNPRLGRFVTPDPRTLNPKDMKLENPQSLNSYSYCINNPLRYIDPTGKWYEEASRQAFVNIAQKATMMDIKYGNSPGYIGYLEERQPKILDCTAFVGWLFAEFYRQTKIPTGLYPGGWLILWRRAYNINLSTALVQAAQRGEMGLEILYPTENVIDRLPGTIIAFPGQNGKMGHAEIIIDARMNEKGEIEIRTVGVRKSIGGITKEPLPWYTIEQWKRVTGAREPTIIIEPYEIIQ